MADLEGIISNAISEVGGGADSGDAGGGDGGTEGTDFGSGHDGESGVGGDAPPATGEISEGAAILAPTSTPIEDAFAKEHGLLNKAGQKENRLPYPRVVKIVENAERKLVEQVLGKAVDGDHKAALTAFVAENAATRTKAQTLEARQVTVDQIEHIMVNDPERFMQMLPYVNPAYSKLFGQGTGQAAPAVPQIPQDMPKPDYDLGNGQFTYSEKGLADLRAWDRKQTEQAVLGQVEQKFKPITDSWEARQRYEAAIPELTARVNHARQNWDGFKDNEAAILEVITSNKAASLHDAYIKVINAKQKEQLAAATTDRAKIREELLKEINGAARSTASIPNAGAAKSSADAPRSTEDIIRASITRLKG